MRPPSRKRSDSSTEREELLRKGRAAAPTLREACPSAALINVHLQFAPAALSPHAEQSFILYPGARAFFSFPCPYGDCNGVFNLNETADRVLMRQTWRATGAIECSGVRSRDGLQKQPCGLRLSFVIDAQYESDRPAL